MRLLLVEDDEDLRGALGDALRREHHAVDSVGTIAAARELLAVTLYEVAIVDRGLPDGDGIVLCDPITFDSAVQRPRRVLVLTARDGVADRVGGLDAGADDCLVKPFSVEELSARLRAIGRRSDGEPVRDAVVGDLVVDVRGHRVRRGGSDLRLTSREFAVLRYLVEHVGEVVSAEELLEHCWDAAADPFTDSVRVIVSRLRRKLGGPPLVRTVTGVGYRLEAAP